MSEQTLFRIRNKQRQALTEEIHSWQPDNDPAMKVRDLEDLVQACLLDRDEDKSFITLILQRSCDLDREKLDKVNQLVGEYCDQATATLGELRDRVRAVENLGLSVAQASAVAEAAEDYRRWKEDMPELLLLRDRALSDRLRERITTAINSPANRIGASYSRKMVGEQQ